MIIVGIKASSVSTNMTAVNFYANFAKSATFNVICTRKRFSTIAQHCNLWMDEKGNGADFPTVMLSICMQINYSMCDFAADLI